MVKISALNSLPEPREDDTLAVVNVSGNVTNKVRLGDVPKGFPSGSISADSLATAVFERIYPIGSLYFNGTSSANPYFLLGFGTWVSYASGKAIVGRDANEVEFNTVGKTGGTKEHKLSVEEMPLHDHRIDRWGEGSNYVVSSTKLVGAAQNGVGYSGQAYTRPTGGNKAHNNLQPYIVVQVWIRTA